VIVEHVLGSAIEQLQFGPRASVAEFRVALPPSAGLARFDHRADVNGIGITALSLVLGRPLRSRGIPARDPAAAGAGDGAIRRWATSGRFRRAAAPGWARTLQLDVRRAFASAPETLAALDEALA
jgi:hypothetical protein